PPQRGYLPVSCFTHLVSMPILQSAASVLLLRPFRQPQLRFLGSWVILLDPIGLWREDLPIVDWISAPAERLPGLLFKDPASRAAQSMLALPEDANIAASAIAARVWAFGCTGKFAWPIPDRGLRTRLHRLKVPVLLVWGRDDAIVPVRYTEEWQKEVSDITVTVIDDCGHIPQVEKLNETITAVDEFLTFAEES
ncbi:alpha/beta fold hydrolase, partial [Paraburkholderia elongata]